MLVVGALSLQRGPERRGALLVDVQWLSQKPCCAEISQAGQVLRQRVVVDAGRWSVGGSRRYGQRHFGRAALSRQDHHGVLRFTA